MARGSIALIVAACLAVPLLLWGVLPLTSGASPASEASSLQNRIEKARARLDQKRGTEHVLTTDVASWSRRIRSLQGDISTLQTRETRLQADLDAKRAELARIQDDLRSERARLARLRASLARDRAVLARRLVAIYKADAPDVVTVLLNSHGFAELIERSEFLHRISRQDTHIITLVRVAKADATATSHRLASLESRQQKVTAVVFERRNQVASVKGALVQRRAGYARTRAGKVRALVAVRSDRQQLQAHLDDLEQAAARVADELRSVQGGGGFNQAGPPPQGSGQLIWPVNGPITSGFCERRAWESCHPGIDIGVPTGTPIHAAGSGRVVLMQGEGSSGGYGNFTCIQHTATMSTCYAHQSRFATSVGASVSQGQVIGYSGCTGRCYGPHLHFEVRINGGVVNPLGYL